MTLEIRKLGRLDYADAWSLQKRLARERAAGNASACPKTLAFLDEQGLWPEESG